MQQKSQDVLLRHVCKKNLYLKKKYLLYFHIILIYLFFITSLLWLGIFNIFFLFYLL